MTVYKDRVILDISVVIKISKRQEQGASTGDVRLPSGSLEGRTVWIRLKGVNHVLYIVLVLKHEDYLLSEWPAK